MKKTLILMGFLTSLSAQAELLTECKHIYGHTTVESTETGMRGRIVAADGHVFKDTSEVTEILVRGTELPIFFRDTMASQIAHQLGIERKKVAEAHAFEIDPKGNRDDATGALIVSFFDADKTFLGKGAQIGWSVVSCE